MSHLVKQQGFTGEQHLHSHPTRVKAVDACAALLSDCATLSWHRAAVAWGRGFSDLLTLSTQSAACILHQFLKILSACDPFLVCGSASPYPILFLCFLQK